VLGCKECLGGAPRAPAPVGLPDRRGASATRAVASMCRLPVADPLRREATPAGRGDNPDNAGKENDEKDRQGRDRRRICASAWRDVMTGVPARTLFVAQSWSPGVDPMVFFTTITAALAQAATMTPRPASGNPVAVIIFPGTYPENINIPSWVFLSSGSTEQNAVTINGTVTWRPTGATMEVVQLYFLNIGPTIVTTTGKTGGQTTFTLHGCFVNGLTVNGRSAAVAGSTRDLVHAATCVPGPNPFDLRDCQFEWVAGRLNGMTFNGECLFRIIGSTTIPNPQVVGWSVNGTSTGICTGDNFTSGWTLKSGTSVVFGGCSLSALTVEAGATADIRSSECPDSALSGQGTVSRRSLTTSFGPTVSPPGANQVMFAPLPPFPDHDYTVSLQLTAGPGNPRVTTSDKTGAGFKINDVVRGNEYDVTVIHD
jgi:hypothetical protein